MYLPHISLFAKIVYSFFDEKVASFTFCIINLNWV